MVLGVMGIHSVPATPISANWPTKNGVDITVLNLRPLETPESDGLQRLPGGLGAERLAEAFVPRHVNGVAVLAAAERGGLPRGFPHGGSEAAPPARRHST